MYCIPHQCCCSQLIEFATADPISGWDEVLFRLALVPVASGGGTLLGILGHIKRCSSRKTAMLTGGKGHTGYSFV